MDAPTQQRVIATLLDEVSELKAENSQLRTSTAPAYVYLCPHRPKDVDPFTSTAEAFAGAAKVSFAKPRLWPGAEAGGCAAQLVYDSECLWICYTVSGGSFTDPTEKGPEDVSWAKEVGMPDSYWSILDDDRVEIFFWKQGTPAGSNQEEGESYHIIECNKHGKAIQATVGFRKKMDWTWTGNFRAKLVTGNRMVLGVPWASYAVDLGEDPSPSNLRMFLGRGEKSKEDEGVSATGIWSAWVDPADDEVDFHRSGCFGTLQLQPAS